MRLGSFKILADENIHPDVIRFLREKNFDVVSVFDINTGGKPDLEIIEIAFKEERIIITHDADFGKIIFTSQIKFTGIIYLRPGHIKSGFTIVTLTELLNSEIDLLLPFIIIAENISGKIKIRIRNKMF